LACGWRESSCIDPHVLEGSVERLRCCRRSFTPVPWGTPFDSVSTTGMVSLNALTKSVIHPTSQPPPMLGQSPRPCWGSERSECTVVTSFVKTCNRSAPLLFLQSNLRTRGRSCLKPGAFSARWVHSGWGIPALQGGTHLLYTPALTFSSSAQGACSGLPCFLSKTRLTILYLMLPQTMCTRPNGRRIEVFCGSLSPPSPLASLLLPSASKSATGLSW